MRAEASKHIKHAMMESFTSNLSLEAPAFVFPLHAA